MHSTKLLFVTGALVGLGLFATQLKSEISDKDYQRVVQSHPSVGDVVFTRIGGPIFSRVAETTQSWTSHVGIIVDFKEGDWIVAESGIPFVRKTPLKKFVGRSVGQEFSIRRLIVEPTPSQQRAMLAFANSHLGEVYSLGFDLDSDKTFCSKFVYDAVAESTHQSIGEIETFDHLLHSNPRAPLTFWRLWFLGSIPWDRRTITPASELRSPALRVIVENNL